jgi:molybdopterin-guanine dinucleotide biosynthesis protein B
MQVYGIVGRKNSGKTHLVTRLLRAAVARGLVVSTIKHAHHGFDVDQPGKDSWLHREAGAAEVLVASASRWALLHEHRGDPEPRLADLLARLGPCDLVLVEGFKGDPHPKLEVYRASCGQPPLGTGDAEVEVEAIATDEPAALHTTLPLLALDDAESVLDFILRHAAPDPPALR